jgi:glycine cleavage system H protein
MYPENFRYTKEHEWVGPSEEGKHRIGVTQHAQKELGDVVFVQLAEVDESYAAEASFGVVESVKAVSDVYMPLAAKVVAVNEALEDTPELVNSDPHGEGWLCEVELEDVGAFEGLMTSAQYIEFVGS